MLRFDKLEVIGDSQPRSDAGAELPSVVRELLQAHGEGAIFGMFHVPAPSSPLWQSWRDTAEAYRSRGYWAGLPSTVWRDLIVFAADRRGWAIAMTPRGTAYLLGGSGGAFELSTLDELATYALASFATRIPEAVIGTMKEDYRHDLELAIDRVYVCGERGGSETRYLEAIENGDDAATQTALERGLGAEPLLIAYTRLLWAVCGPRADAFSAARADAIETLLALARRRDRYLASTWLPPGIASGPADPDVRAWALAPFAQDLPRGPFADADPPPLPELVVEPLVDTDRPPRCAVWVDAGATLREWAAAWDDPLAVELRDRCLRDAKRFAIVQLINELRRPQVFRSGEPALEYMGEALHRREDSIVTRLGAAKAHAWPFVLLALRSVDGGIARRLLQIVEGASDPIIEPMLRSLVLRPNLGHPRIGGCSIDPGQYAAVYLRDYQPTTELVEQLVPELSAAFARWKAAPALDAAHALEGTIRLVASRVELASVRSLACKHFDASSAVFGPALARSRDEAALALLRKKARARDVHVRMDAARALVAARDPGAAALLVEAEKARDRVVAKM